jgi:hypothetical protein
VPWTILPTPPVPQNTGEVFGTVAIGPDGASVP